MKRAFALLLGLVIVAVVVVELGAETIATRLLVDRAAGQVVYDRAQVTSINRPASIDVLQGRVRSVEVVATGVVIDGIRLDRVVAVADEVALPWSAAANGPVPVAGQVTVTESDLQAALRARVSLPVEPVVELEAGTVALGIEGLDARVRVEVRVDDGRIWLAARDTPAWYVALGLPAEIDVYTLPADVRIEHLAIGDDAAYLELSLPITIGGDPPR